MLYLIPTPIDDKIILEPSALKKLEEASLSEKAIICVEELKVARRRWLSWGLRREAIDNFYIYNEHNAKTASLDLLSKLKKGHQVFLMSDCGLPAFCDPGQLLVELCHQNKIKVSATAFSNSVILALSLSGFKSDRFIFEGFLASRGEERVKDLKRIAKQKETTILMDTPYRLNQLLRELKEYAGDRMLFLAMDLNRENEELLLDKVKNFNLDKVKREFVLVLGPK